MAIKKYPEKKDPNSTVDYGRIWGGDEGWLATDETIIESIWLISSKNEPQPTLKQAAQGSGISADKKNTSVWITGGTAGINYNLTNRITTNQGRVEDASGVIVVQEK